MDGGSCAGNLMPSKPLMFKMKMLLHVKVNYVINLHELKIGSLANEALTQ
ncbi:hypothetical protein TNCT_310621, partial [Trichonephila clavata]